MHGDHHCAKVIRLRHGLASFGRFHPFGTAQHFKPMREILQVLAFRRVDDADATQRNIQGLRNFFNLSAVAKKDGCAKAQRVELPSGLEDARFSAFREDDSLRMPLQLLNNTANETHGALSSARLGEGQHSIETVLTHAKVAKKRLP